MYNSLKKDENDADEDFDELLDNSSEDKFDSNIDDLEKKRLMLKESKK